MKGLLFFVSGIVLIMIGFFFTKNQWIAIPIIILGTLLVGVVGYVFLSMIIPSSRKMEAFLLGKQEWERKNKGN